MSKSKSPEPSAANSNVNLFTLQNPAIAEFNGAFYMVYQGQNITAPTGGHNIAWAVFNGQDWKSLGDIVVQNQRNLQTPASPALFVYNNTLYMVYQGVLATNEIYWASYNGSGTQWNNLGVISALPAGIAVGS